MMTQNNKNIIFGHFVFWILDFSYGYWLKCPNPFLFGIIVYQIALVGSFYINWFWVFPGYFIYKKKINAFFAFFLSLLWFFSLVYFRIWFYHTYQPNRPIISLPIPYLNTFLVYSTFALIFWIFPYISKNNRLIIQREKKQRNDEILFLKSQINQHFLYNTLNHIYSEALLYNQKLADSILNLSEYLRYTLSKSFNQLVTLKDEIENTQKLIQLNQPLNTNQVEMKISGQIEGFFMCHLTLLSLAETIFKNNNIQKAIINLKASEEDLMVKITNKIENQIALIDFENYMEYLQIRYPKNYTFEEGIHNKNQIVKITIPNQHHV